MTPNDFYFSSDLIPNGVNDQWTFEKMQLPAAWDIETGDSSVVVAVLDDGLVYNHPELFDQIWINPQEDINGNRRFDGQLVTLGGDIDMLDQDGNGFFDDIIGFNFYWAYGGLDPCEDPPGEPFCPFWPHPNGNFCCHQQGSHAAFVGSIISAKTNNSIGVAGGTWHTKLMNVGVGYGGSVYLPAVSWGIDYAVEMGADIINMSFGSFADDPYVRASVQAAVDAGVILVASAGNNNADELHYPGSYPGVIRVAAVDESLNRTSGSGGSSYGATVSITAPVGPPVSFGGGSYLDGIVTCDYDALALGSLEGDVPPFIYRYNDLKTSGAAAEVTAVVSLLRARYPAASAQFIKAELFRGAVPLSDPLWNPNISLSKLGHGMVNAYRSLSMWGTITASATWSGTVFVSGDLTVAPGATLTIAPGTTVLVAGYDNEQTGVDIERVEFNIEGTLIADGTTSNPIVFESWTPTTSEDWVGFYFDAASGGGVFDNCRISRAEYAIESYKPLAVTNTVIEDCRYGAVIVQAGSSLIQGCTINRPGTYGVFLTSASTTIRNTTIDNAVSAACHVQPNAALVARNSHFTNSDKGLYVGGGNVASVDTCTLTGNDIGIHFYNTGNAPVVRNSTIDNNASIGVFCDNSSHPLIEKNTIRYNGAGVYCANYASPLIQLNTIKSNTNGVGAASGGNPDIGHCCGSGGNTFAYNAAYHVANFNSFTIFAQNNCWNRSVAPCVPPAARIAGDVDTASPICCSVGPSSSSISPGELEPDPVVATDTKLVAAVPNPFNPSTTVHYSVASPGRDVVIAVYDVAGRLVRSLVDGAKSAGNHSVAWDGTNDDGRRVASAVYFVKLTAGTFTGTIKLVLLK